MDARHFISLVLLEQLDSLIECTITIEQFQYLVDALEKQSFVEEHKDFFPAFRELALNCIKRK